jgi:hypothetical protein
VNREARLRRLLDGTGLEGEAAVLAANPDAGLIAAVIKASRDAAVKHAAELRKRQRQERKYDADQVGEAAGRMLGGVGKRGAGGDIDAAAVLYDLIERRGKALLALTVSGLRGAGYSDPEIARAFGITPQAVGQRFGRKGAFNQDRRPGAAE